MNNPSVLITRLSKRAGRFLWIAVTLICLLSLVNIAERGFNSNLLTLIPQRAEKTRLYLKLIRDFGIMDETYIILDGDIMESAPLIDRFAKDLSASDLIREVSYRLDPSVIDFLSRILRKNSLLYLKGDELNEALARLHPENMEKRLRKIKDRLILPSKSVSMNDPLGFSELLLSRMPSPGVPFDGSSGYFLTEDGRRLIVIIKPAGDARDIDFDERLMEFIDETFGRHFKDMGSIRMGMTGSHPITYYEQAIVKSDIRRNMITAFIGVAAVFILFLRTLRGMAFALLPVLFSVITTMGVSSAVFGAMSEVSGAFGAMIVGLGVDLAVVLYIRNLYAADIEGTVKKTSGAVWAGVLTTAATFYPMVLSDFRGIKELGFLTATGIIVCAVFIFLFAPHLMPVTRMKKSRITFLEVLPVYALRYKKSVMGICIITAVVSIYGIGGMVFSADLQGLGAETNPARRLFASLDIERGGTLIAGTASTIDGAISASSHISDTLADNGVTGVASLASFIPGVARRTKALEEIRKVDIDAALRDFRRLARKHGFSDDHVLTMSRNIRGFFDIKEPVSIEDFSGPGMDGLLKKFYGKEGDGYKFLVMARDDKDVSEVIRDYEATGPGAVRRELSSLLKKDAKVITALGILFVNIILFIKFRNILHIVYAQIPVILSIMLTGAIMGFLGIPVHIMNALVAVMLFGIGTDYGIHLIHHINRKRDVLALSRETGRAITIAAYTTVAGFGSIYFSSYRGLSEMGLAVTIGCILTLVFSLMLIPILMGMNTGGTGREEDPS